MNIPTLSSKILHPCFCRIWAASIETSGVTVTPLILLRLLCCRPQQCICYYVHWEAKNGYDSFIDVLSAVDYPWPYALTSAIPFQNQFHDNGCICAAWASVHCEELLHFDYNLHEVSNGTLQTFGSLAEIPIRNVSCQCIVLWDTKSDAAHHDRWLHITHCWCHWRIWTI